MNYWLMKSEPDEFSIHDLKAKKISGWNGVRNYTARNNLRAMKKGDRAFFYHSSTEPTAIVGEMEVVREAYPDGPDPAWVQVDVRFVRKFARPLTLEEVKATKALKTMWLVKFSRLSVQPVTPAEWKEVLKRCA
jgi:predicted RNA-binding protein with PUA-like domain